MNAIAHAARTGVGSETEWEHAELFEELELLQSRVDELSDEREQLRTDLRVAQLWVKELALWLDEAQARTGGAALSAPGLTLAPETLAALREHDSKPVPWRRLATVGAIATAPWAIVAGLACVMWIAL